VDYQGEHAELLRQEQEEIKRNQERLEEEERVAVAALHSETERLEREKCGP
jgi:hypothetical protein